MQTPSKLPSQTHRLLYRGCLSLPDSHLLLDGLSFSVKLGDPHGSPALLNNPLALTLESLRGLPLHLIGTSKVKDTWIDPPGDIFVYVASSGCVRYSFTSTQRHPPRSRPHQDVFRKHFLPCPYYLPRWTVRPRHLRQSH